MKANYVFPDVADKVATALADNAAHGAYDRDDKTDSFAAALTRDLSEAGHDRHLRVNYDPSFRPPPGDGHTPDKQDLQRDEDFVRRMGFGIARVERLPGNVGYLDIRNFLSADLVKGAYASALGLLAGTDALILDLRGNGGGDPEAVATLLSHFFAAGDRRHLNDMYWRKGKRIQPSWTRPVGEPYYTRPIYVLTSRFTFSGGEECAYDLKTQKRATLVGENTGGGANPGETFPLAHGFVAFIPTGRAVNPITHTNWEHVGVVPDVAVPAADAMKTAYVAILRALLAKSGDEDERTTLHDALARTESGELALPAFTPPHRRPPPRGPARP